MSTRSLAAAPLPSLVPFAGSGFSVFRSNGLAPASAGASIAFKRFCINSSKISLLFCLRNFANSVDSCLMPASPLPLGPVPLNNSSAPATFKGSIPAFKSRLAETAPGFVAATIRLLIWLRVSAATPPIKRIGPSKLIINSAKPLKDSDNKGTISFVSAT